MLLFEHCDLYWKPMSKIKKIRRRIMWPIEGLFIYSMLFSIKLLTFRGARRVGAILGSLIYMVPSSRKLILANLKLALPDKSQAELIVIAKKSCRGLMTVYIEFMWFYKSPARMEKYIKVPKEMEPKLAEINDPNQAVLFFGMHWGNWELMTYGLKCSFIARYIKNPLLEKFITEGREYNGCSVLHEKGAVRGIMKALKQKKTVGMLVDQNTKTHQGGTFANFLNLPVTVSKTPALLAMKMKPKVFLCNCKRTKDGFEVCIKDLPQDVEKYENEADLTQAMVDMMAAFVKEAPEQWVWLYKRWNYIPTNWADRKDHFPFYSIMDKNLEFTP